MFVLDSLDYERFVVKEPKMKINAVEFMYEELSYKSSTSKYKKQTVILIFPIYRTYLFMCCVFHLKNDDTLLIALIIGKYHETTPGLE